MSKITGQLEDILLKLKEKNNQEGIKYIEEAFDYFIDQYEKAVAIHEPQDIAYTFQKLVDEALLESGIKQQASCKQGCSFCCYQPINVSKEEAHLLKNEYTDIIKEHEEILAIQSQCTDVKEWSKLPAKYRVCIFLSEEGNCRVYEHRPIVCRKYFVVGSPEQCDTLTYPNGQVAVLGDWQAETIDSAIINVTETGLLPIMLNKADETNS